MHPLHRMIVQKLLFWLVATMNARATTATVVGFEEWTEWLRSPRGEFIAPERGRMAVASLRILFHLSADKVRIELHADSVFEGDPVDIFAVYPAGPKPSRKAPC